MSRHLMIIQTLLVMIIIVSLVVVTSLAEELEECRSESISESISEASNDLRGQAEQGTSKLSRQRLSAREDSVIFDSYNVTIMCGDNDLTDNLGGYVTIVPKDEYTNAETICNALEDKYGLN